MCLLLGGASAAGIWANAALQILAVLIILPFAARSGPAVPGSRPLLVAAGLVLILVAIELVPLPWGVVDRFPGRAPIVAGYRLLGLTPSWQHVSLDPDATIASALALLPFFAVAAATIHAARPSRDAAVTTLLAMIVIEIAFGALQLTGGGNHYFYAITNASSAVGFFANANHMATLLLIGLPYVAAVGTRRSSSTKRNREQRGWLSLALFLVICLGVLLNGSAAGLGLLLPAIGASYLIYRRAAGRSIRWHIVLLLVVVAVLILGFLMVGPFHGQFLDQSLSEADPTTRRTSWAVTAQAAREYFPVGSGLGSFVPIYHLHEDLARVTTTFVNHAHNDYLELLLELGLAGLIGLVLFLAWFIRRAIVVWRSDEADLTLARAGSVAVGIVMLHSIVDYPLRTAAIASAFALSVALLGAPVAVIRTSARTGRSSAGRHFTAEQATS